MARRADRTLRRGIAGGCGYALTRFAAVGARGSRWFALRIGAVPFCRPGCNATARQTSPRGRLLRLRLWIRTVGAFSSGRSCNLAHLWTARRRGALRCRAALRSALTRAHGMRESYAGVATVGGAGGTSSRVAPRGGGVRMLRGVRSHGALAGRRNRVGGHSRLLRCALRTGSGCSSRGAARSRTACGGGISVCRRHCRSSSTPSRCSPSGRARRAGIHPARGGTRIGGVASRRFVDQAFDRNSGRSVRGRRDRLRNDISQASVVAFAHRTGADAGWSARRRASALLSRHRNDACGSLCRRAPFVYRKTNARRRTGRAGALRDYVLSRGCSTDRGSSRSGASRF